MMPECHFCDGGRWVDHYHQQTLFCPFCRPREADLQARARLELPSWCDYWAPLPAEFYGPRLQVDPWLLVLHSGSTAPGVAEYFARPGDRRQVSAHLAWSRTRGKLVQCVPLTHVAWHCGGSRYQGQGGLNHCSIGIELPGPWNKARGDGELGDLRASVEQLIRLVPSLRVAVRHSDIDSGKRDPGPGFTWDCLAGLGLEIG